MFYTREYTIHKFDEKLKAILEEKYRLPVQVTTHMLTGEPIRLSFEISEQNPQAEELAKLFPLDDDSWGFVLYEAHYSIDEMRSAKWLYVINTTGKVEAVNGKTLYTHQCFVKTDRWGKPVGRHEVQNEPYVLKAPIKWGRSAFVSDFFNQSRLFCNDTVRNILYAENISGLQFLPVIKKATGQPFGDIFQLGFTHTVPDGALVPLSHIKESICEQCGMHMLQYLDQKARFGVTAGSLDETIDCWQTLPMFFGPGSKGLRGFEQLIVSQKMYRLLTEKKMDRGFVFKPLEIVEL